MEGEYLVQWQFRTTPLKSFADFASLET